jgi:pimeloyl-ACP methyl ester carboxylesterase
MAVEEGHIEGLPYLATGNGEPLVVCSGLTMAHENPSGVGRMLEVQTVKPFAARRRVYQINRKPHLAERVTMHDIASDYAKALSSHFGGPVDVIGISTGGSVSLQLALDFPEAVRRLVVASSACRLGPFGKEAQLRMAQMAAAGDRRACQREIGRMLVANPVGQRVLGGVFWAAGSLVMGRADDLTDMARTILAEDAFDATPRLSEISAPTLVVGGERDQFYSPGLFRQTAEGIPNGRLALYEGKGHVGALAGKRFPTDVFAFFDQT